MKRKVLIAEDEPVSRRMLEAFLSRWGYEAIVARNGAEAWDSLSSVDSPRLALLDWMMPELNGIDVCRKVRQLSDRPYVYILLLTAKSLKQDLLEAFDAGADDFLTKPFDAAELHGRLLVGDRIVTLQDSLIAAREALRFQATHDPLTGLLNRGAILVALSRELDRSGRQGHSVGVILADIDHFKLVNDTYGHAAGDAVLQEVGRRMSASLRSYDSVGRYGGEEFLIIVPSSDAQGALRSAERMRASLQAQPVHTPDGEVAVNGSFGVIVAGGPGRLYDQSALLHAADAALYRAKDNGRNRVELAAPPDPSPAPALDSSLPSEPVLPSPRKP